MALQACLGLTVNAKEARIYLYHTTLPEALRQVEIRNVMVGSSILDIAFERYPETVGVNILRRTGDVEILTQK
jgi:hypothetical protein